MTDKFPPIEKIFDELDRFRDFCRYEGKPYREESLYRDHDPVWKDYKRYLAYHERNRKNIQYKRNNRDRA